MERKTCDSCHFWEAFGRADDDGLCHRYPPVVVYLPEAESAESFCTHTFATFWCGEFSERKEPSRDAVLSTQIIDLGLSIRARKACCRLGLRTVGDLASRTAEELQETRNFGVVSLMEIRQKLSELGLALRNDDLLAQTND